MMHIIILYFEFIYMFEPTINTNLTTFFKQQFMDVIALAVNVIIIWIKVKKQYFLDVKKQQFTEYISHLIISYIDFMLFLY